MTTITSDQHNHVHDALGQISSPDYIDVKILLVYPQANSYPCAPQVMAIPPEHLPLPAPSHSLSTAMRFGLESGTCSSELP